VSLALNRFSKSCSHSYYFCIIQPSVMSKLEEQKLRLEIAEIEKPWYKNLDFWKTVIPTVAIIASLYFTVGQGVIDFEKRKLELQKEQLKLEVLQFEGTKKDVQKEISALSKEKESVLLRLRQLIVERNRVSQKTLDLTRNLQLLKEESDKTKLLFAGDKAFYLERLKKEYELEKSYLSQIEAMESDILEKEITIAIAQKELEFLRPRSPLSSVERLRLEASKNEVSANVLGKNAKKAQKRAEELHELSKKYQTKKDKINAREVQLELELYGEGVPIR